MLSIRIPMDYLGVLMWNGVYLDAIRDNLVNGPMERKVVILIGMGVVVAATYKLGSYLVRSAQKDWKAILAKVSSLIVILSILAYASHVCFGEKNMAIAILAAENVLAIPFLFADYFLCSAFGNQI